jgi:hypothetical protein
MSLESMAGLGGPAWPVLTSAGLLCLALFLVSRQNHKDLLGLMGTRAEA